MADGALPRVAEIDGDQPEDAGYNPSISGVNLDFNRVFAAWEAGGKALSFSAPGEKLSVPVASVRGELVADGPPRHRMAGEAEIWSLPVDGMRRRGSVWLPVRRPAAYAGEVMRGLGGEAGLALPAAAVVRAVPEGGVLAVRESDPLVQVVREMLLYSTNLTAETVGLRASQARGLAPEGLRPSAAAMTGWARARFGLKGARFVNHSGLSAATRISPAELASVLRQAEGLGLPGLLKPRPILDARRQPVAVGVAVMSKTGTMNFVSGLAGYLTGRRRMAFAILAVDPGRSGADPAGSAGRSAGQRRLGEAGEGAGAGAAPALGGGLCGLKLCSRRWSARSRHRSGPMRAQEGADAAAIRGRLEGWAAAFNAGDAARVCDLFADDLISVVPDAPDAGKAEVCARLARILARDDARFAYRPEIDEVLVWGDTRRCGSTGC